MSSKGRTKAQVRKDKAALKRLQKSGVYKGKIDLRKAPSKYQLKKIEALKSAKPTKTPKSKQPLPPKSPVPGAKIKRTRISEKELRNLPPAGGKHALVTYALPFLRKGRDEPEWRRFTRQQLTKFLNEYKAGEPEAAAEWKSYAVKEEWTFATKTEKQEFRRETDLYFSGVRIDEPKGVAKKMRKTKGHSKPGTKRAATGKN